MFIKFTVNNDKIPLWESILDYLEEHEANSKLQDMMEPFGSEVDDKLEQLIETYGTEEALHIEFWNREDNVFSVMIHSLDWEHEGAVRELFAACPIAQLEQPDVEE